MPVTAKDSTTPSAAALPIVLFGIDSRGRPKAARFGKEHAALATKAASQMQLRILPSTDPKVLAIVSRLPVGRIHGNGRTFVPFVRRDLYDQLVAAAPNGTAVQSESGSSTGSANNSSSGGGGGGGSNAPNLPRTWQDIGVGDLVIAQETLEDGWFEAIVMEASSDMLTLRWRDYPRERRIVRHRRRLGLLYPDAQPVASAKATKPTPSSKHPEKPTAAKPSAKQQTLPRSWQEIDVDALVLARTEGPLPTWWEAIPIEKTGDTFKLRWRDHGNIPPITRPRLQLALICPDAT